MALGIACRSTKDGRFVAALCTALSMVPCLVASEALGAIPEQRGSGPPPAGYTCAVPAPAGFPELAGRQPHVVVDEYGDPHVAYLAHGDTTGDRPDDETLYTVSWDRVSRRWGTPVRVASVRDPNIEPGVENLSFARDPSTGLLGLAYQVGQYRIDISWSRDGGDSWSGAIVEDDADRALDAPSLVLTARRAHLVFRSERGVRYMTGSPDSSLAGWTVRDLKGPENTRRARADGLSVRVDTAGAAAVACWMDTYNDGSPEAVFWRPGGKPQILLAPSPFKTAQPSLAWAFRGGVISAVLGVARDAEYSRGDHQLWWTESRDAGATWGAPVAVPQDGGAAAGGRLEFACGPRGELALVAERTGGSPVGEQCGEPKLIRTHDGSHWTICSPAGVADRALNAAHPSVAFTPAGKLVVAAQNISSDGPPGPGVVVWREP